MIMTDSPELQVSGQLDYPSAGDELNRLLCAAVVSKRFRNVLISNPELAVESGYQGESFTLSEEDRGWLFSLHPANLIDLAAHVVTHQQESRVKLPVQPVPQFVQVN